MSSPSRKYRFGNVTLSRFENTNTKDGKSFQTSSYSPQKTYKAEHDWKFTNSYKPSELPFLIQCCVEALNDYYRKDTPEPKSEIAANSAPF